MTWRDRIKKDGELFVKIEGHGEKLYNEEEVAQEVRTLILKGVDPPLPPEVLNSTDPAIKAILQARKLATAYDVDKRPRAREIASILDKAASKLGLC